MEIGKKIINFILVFLTVVSVFATGLLVYYKTIGKNNVPTGVTSTYATTIDDQLTGETYYAIEANYYENQNKTGYEVVELLFNCYSGISKQTVYSRGFQICYDTNGNVVEYVYSNGDTEYSRSHVFQYNRTQGASFETGHEYAWGDKMLMDINGKVYGVALDGTYTLTETKTDGWKIVRTIGTLGLNLLFEKNKSFTYNVTTKYNYSFEDLLIKIKQIIKSCSNGTGDYVIPLVDLGDFLHVYDVDNDGQISQEPIGANTLQNSYFTIQTHYDTKGIVWAKQSIFGSVAGDSQFNIGGIKKDIDYWHTTNQITLTENDFEARYVTAEKGFYYALPVAKINELKNFDDLEIVIDFNIDRLGDVNCLGLDYYALYGIEVAELKISSNHERTFTLLVNSLKDTNLTSIQTSNVKINDFGSGVNI